MTDQNTIPTVIEKNIKWSQIYNVINGAPRDTPISTSTSNINIGAYVGQLWSDNTFVPSKNISIKDHFAGKSIPGGYGDIKIKPYIQEETDRNFLIDYAPVNYVYDYSYFNFVVTGTELINSGITKRTGIKAVTFQLKNWTDRFPGANNQRLSVAEVSNMEAQVGWPENSNIDIYVDGRDVNQGATPKDVIVKLGGSFRPSQPDFDTFAGKSGITVEMDPVSRNEYTYYKITFDTVFTWSGEPGTHLLFKWYNGDGSYTFSGGGDILAIQGEDSTGATALIFADGNNLLFSETTRYPLNHRIHSRPNITLETTEPGADDGGGGGGGGGGIKPPEIPGEFDRR